MDPNAALQEIREITADVDTTNEYLPRLAEVVEALDEWLSSGGFPPDAWSHWITPNDGGRVMDPNEILRRMRSRSATLTTHSDPRVSEIADLVTALDALLSTGSHLPDDWQVKDAPDLDANGERRSYTPPF